MEHTQPARRSFKKKKKKRLSSHMLAAFLFCVGRRRHGRLKGQKVNLREFETSAAFVMNVSGRCLPKNSR